MGILQRLGSIWRGKRQNQIQRSPYQQPQLDMATFLRMQAKAFKPQDVLPAFWNGQPKWPEFNSETAITQGFKGSSWVYVGINKNATALSMVPWRVERRDGDAWVWDRDHPAQQLIDSPNPWWSRQHFIYLLVTELLVTGNTLVSKVRIGEEGVPVELYTVRPQRIAPLPGDEEFINEYEVIAADGKRYRCASGDVVHIMMPDPECVYWGLSPLQAAMRAYDTDREAANWQKTNFQNMMIPPGMFVFDKEITRAQFEAAKAQLKEEYQGSINAGAPLLLGDGAKYQPLAISASEASFLETRQATMKEIFAVLGVPLEVVLSSDSTFANAANARSIWWEETLIPLASIIGGALNAQLVSEFSDHKQYRVVPDTSNIRALIATLNGILDAALKLRTLGYTTNQINDRLRLGMPKVPWGNTGWVSNSESPVDALLADVDTFNG